MHDALWGVKRTEGALRCKNFIKGIVGVRLMCCTATSLYMLEGEIARSSFPCRRKPYVANLHRGRTRQSASDAASRSLGQVEPLVTTREILFRARVQMACCGASLAVVAGSSLQR